MKIFILKGGNGPEREISLRSARMVANATRENGYAVEEIDIAKGLDFLSSVEQDDLVFPILHGIGGEDGSVQAELEKRGLKFLGSGSVVSRICFNKWEARQEFQKAGLNVAKGELVDQQLYKQCKLTKRPHVLKSVNCGSSIGVYIVRDPTNINPSMVDEVFRQHPQAVVEELIIGTEVTIPILGDKALPIIEIIPPAGQEFDYDNKYNGKTREICPPASVGLEAQKALASLAEKAHAALKCRHLSRVDVILRDDGKPFILEINTIPGLTDQSLYPKSAEAAGISFAELIKRFVEMVKNDYR